MARILAGAFLFAGCGFLEKGGNSKEGWFIVSPSDFLTAGTKMDLAIIDYEPSDLHRVATIEEASAGEQVTIDAIDRDVLHLSAVAAGTADLRFTATADDEARPDAYAMTVIAPKRLELGSLCSATYLANRDADIAFWFSDESHARGQGYGHYPVMVEGATLVEAQSTAKTMRIRMGDTTATVRSTLFPPNEVPATLNMNVVDASSVDGVELFDVAASGTVIGNARLMPGDKRLLRVIPVFGQELLCGTTLETRVSVDESHGCRLAATYTGELATSIEGTLTEVVLVATEWGVCDVTFEIIEAGLAFSSVRAFDLAEPESSGGGGGGFDFD
jgi:hypothetical protein